MHAWCTRSSQICTAAYCSTSVLLLIVALVRRSTAAYIHVYSKVPTTTACIHKPNADQSNDRPTTATALVTAQPIAGKALSHPTELLAWLNQLQHTKLNCQHSNNGLGLSRACTVNKMPAGPHQKVVVSAGYYDHIRSDVIMRMQYPSEYDGLYNTIDCHKLSNHHLQQL